MKQRNMMRTLYRDLGDNEPALVNAYAKAERDRIVTRKGNTSNLSAEQYARALYNDGIEKEWITDDPTE